MFNEVYTLIIGKPLNPVELLKKELEEIDSNVKLISQKNKLFVVGKIEQKIVDELAKKVSEQTEKKLNVLVLSNQQYDQMKEIIRYHVTAGHRIRKALLSKLRSLIKKGISITDHYNLTLSEPGAGEMSVYRVAGADTETIQIPYTKVGVIMELDD